eukprot:TRINITY_DN14056_c0_g1_i1.p1 TRINITY_DN14056_c0_g1~~TRINITY_DN14056_c0_g1_i1.p1  ORF type:complete len:498 (+),score=117.68 TRINITY_DN14056_c0_g1_i1:119-1495(+)
MAAWLRSWSEWLASPRPELSDIPLVRCSGPPPDAAPPQQSAPQRRRSVARRRSLAPSAAPPPAEEQSPPDPPAEPAAPPPPRTVSATPPPRAAGGTPPPGSLCSPPPALSPTTSLVVHRRDGEGTGLILGEDLRLRSVRAGSPAERAGAAGCVGQRLTHVAGNPVSSLLDAGDAMGGLEDVPVTFLGDAPQRSPAPAMAPSASMSPQQQPPSQRLDVSLPRLRAPALGGALSAAQPRGDTGAQLLVLRRMRGEPVGLNLGPDMMLCGVVPDSAADGAGAKALIGRRLRAVQGTAVATAEQAATVASRVMESTGGAALFSFGPLEDLSPTPALAPGRTSAATSVRGAVPCAIPPPPDLSASRFAPQPLRGWTGLPPESASGLRGSLSPPHREPPMLSTPPPALTGLGSGIVTNRYSGSSARISGGSPPPVPPSSSPTWRPGAVISLVPADPAAEVFARR